METTPTRTTRRSSTVLVGAGAFAGAAAVLLLGAAFTQDPQPARPAGRIKPTPEQVTAETDAANRHTVSSPILAINRMSPTSRMSWRE